MAIAVSQYTGDTGQVWTFQATWSNLTHPDVTGFTASQFRLHIYDSSNSPTVIVCAGTGWTVLDGPNGVVSYQPVAADVAVAGLWTPQFSINFNSGGSAWSSFDCDQIQIKQLR